MQCTRAGQNALVGFAKPTREMTRSGSRSRCFQRAATAMPLLADAAPPLLLVVGDADRLTASDAALKSLLQRITKTY